MTDENLMWIGLIYLLVINIFAFFTMKVDKTRAVKGRWRTSEKLLLFLSLIGGSIGMLMGMRQFRHKTNKPLFKIGLPTIILLQLFILGFIINM